MTYKIIDWIDGEQVERDATPEEAADIDARKNAPPDIPQVVTMRQARRALLATGMLAQIPNAIAALPSPQKEQAEIDWEYSQDVHRNWPLVKQLAPSLGLTEGQIDQLFIIAATL
jgi:hypothetical protein